MQKKRAPATLLGFVLVCIVEMLLPSFYSELLGVSAANSVSAPLTQTGNIISSSATDQPRFSKDSFTVGIQVGHDHRTEIPAELAALEGNTGAQSGEKTEVESNRRIARETARLLENEGVTVELLPAIVPKNYTADVFITIHADGSPRDSATGFKIAAPENDQTGKADLLVSLLDEEYQSATGLVHDVNNITSNMRQYYAFNYERYDHAISPATPAAIVETGFISNREDQVLIYDNPSIPAKGIANGVLRFLDHLLLERQAVLSEPVFQKR